MKKVVVSLLFVTLLFFSCTNKTISSEIIDDLNGKIEYYKISYQSTLYFEDDILKEKDKTKISIEYFDSSNNLLKEFRTLYGDSYHISSYDEEGNQVGYKIYDEKGKMTYRSDFLLNDEGKIISTIEYDKNSKYAGESKNIYDYNGNILQIFVFDENKKYNNSIIYAYNNEKIYSVTHFINSLEMPYVSIYTYDMEGKLRERKQYYNGHLVSTEKIMEYDEKNKEVKSMSYIYNIDGNEIPSTAQYYEYHYETQ